MESRKILSGGCHAVSIVWSFQEQFKTDLCQRRQRGKDIVNPALGLRYTVEYCDYVLCQKDLENARRKWVKAFLSCHTVLLV